MSLERALTVSACVLVGCAIVGYGLYDYETSQTELVETSSSSHDTGSSNSNSSTRPGGLVHDLSEVNTDTSYMENDIPFAEFYTMDAETSEDNGNLAIFLADEEKTLHGVGKQFGKIYVLDDLDARIVPSSHMELLKCDDDTALYGYQESGGDGIDGYLYVAGFRASRTEVVKKFTDGKVSKPVKEDIKLGGAGLVGKMVEYTDPYIPSYVLDNMENYISYNQERLYAIKRGDDCIVFLMLSRSGNFNEMTGSIRPK